MIFVLTAVLVVIYCFTSCDINKPDDDDLKVKKLSLEYEKERID